MPVDDRKARLGDRRTGKGPSGRTPDVRASIRHSENPALRLALPLALPLGVALVVSLIEGAPERLPGVALGSEVLLHVERAAAIFAIVVAIASLLREAMRARGSRRS